MNYDMLVVGSGIGGMESALKLGDMGYKVLLVEKEASVGGKMILLSKVFPTLDCASCISTPKMAATIHHPNITVLTYSEVEGIRRDGNGKFQAKIRRKPPFVDPAACTGCRQCEMACNVAVPDQFNADLVSRRAAYIAFPQAVPKKAVIERAGTSPCTFTCPAGIKSHGYVALVRSGQYEKAFNLILESTPLVGSLGRACFAPCEEECTRGSLEGPLPIRRLKRFIADTHYRDHERPAVEIPDPNGKKVAIVGSGPAGLTAAWQLARQGYQVKILEAAPQPGGMLRLAIPAYRLPAEVVDQDVRNVTSLGVEIATDTRVEDLEELKRQGFDAVLVATGTPRAARLNVPGEELKGVHSSLDFLRAVKLGPPPDLKGQDVVVIGGGNVAIDVSRSARRLGAKSVRQVSLESRTEMPAHTWEVEEAMAEGVTALNSWGVKQLLGEDQVRGVELKRCTAVFDADRRFSPQYDETVTDRLDCDAVIVAIGMGPDTAAFAGQVRVNKNRTIQVDPVTMQTNVPYIFAAGDVVSGASFINTAAGRGRKAAFMIDRWLQGKELNEDELDPKLPVVDKAQVLARQQSHSRRDPVPGNLRLSPEPRDFTEIEAPMTEEEALTSVGRCLDCGVCSECHQCVAICPANAVHMEMREQKVEAEVGAVIVSTGFKLFPADLKPQYGYGKFKNVITGMQMDRLLAPTRPYNTVLRPGDGKVPDRIAYILCTGSRDQTVDNPLCSRVCCMYSIKQNQLIMGALPLADVTVYYIDIRAFSKGYDEFYEQAKAMGAMFVKGRVARIKEKEDGNLLLSYEDIENGGQVTEAEHDLVVLAVGIQPNAEAGGLFPDGGLKLDDYYYVQEVDEDLDPGRTSIDGVFVAGSASGAKDIPDSILHAGAAAAQAAAYVEKVGRPS
ncbi:MAG TPA: FAD-dependent oxidoreductase [Bacillota bacterium]